MGVRTVLEGGLFMSRSVSLRGLAGSHDSVDGRTMQVFRFGWKDYAFECYLD